MLGTDVSTLLIRTVQNSYAAVKVASLTSHRTVTDSPCNWSESRCPIKIAKVARTFAETSHTVRSRVLASVLVAFLPIVAAM